MISTRGYAAKAPSALLEPYEFGRRDLGPYDVLIDILYCGICHSDIHQARDEWGGALFPMVPGHEIVGRVSRVGPQATRFKVGDLAGAGCFVDSCRTCVNCKEGVEQYCERHVVWTYNGTEKDGKTPTYGGYSNHIVVDEAYTFKVPSQLPLPNVAPLLCAGITTYSPLRRYRVGPGQRVGVIGLGGLGHMAVKLAASMGAEVTVFSTSQSKERDARRLGAHDFVVSKDPKNVVPLAGRFDFLIDTISAPHDPNPYINLLRRTGVMVLVGVPEKPLTIQAYPLVSKGRVLAGSNIGGLRETQEMLDYCTDKKITPDIEVIPIQKVNEAFDRAVKGDVQYRFVIDLSTL